MACTWLLLPLWTAGADGSGPGLPAGHDTAFHLVVARSFGHALAEGVVYPRWVDGMQAGLGAPVFHFYPPLPYFVTGTLQRLLGGDTFLALRTSFSVAVLLAAGAFWLAFRRRLGHGLACWGAALFVLVPQLRIDLYERCALPSVWAFVWLPLLLGGVLDAVESPRSLRRWLWLALACAGLLVTHTLSAVLLAYALGPLLLGWLVVRRDGVRRVLSFVAASVGTVGLGGAIAAAFLLPLLAHRQLVHADWIKRSDHGDFARNFLFVDEVARGFRAAPIKPVVEQAASVVAILALVLVLGLWWGRRRSVSAPVAHGTLASWPAVLAVGALWAFALQTAVSTPIWSLGPALAWAQFPWRLGSVQGLLVVTAIVGVLGSRQERRSLPWGLVAALVLALAVPRTPGHGGVAFGGDVGEIDRRVHELIVPEYLPRRLDAPEAFPPAPRLPFRLTRGRMVVTARSAHRVELRVGSETETELHAGFAFPGWQAWREGTPLGSRVDPESARWVVPLPEGAYRVTLVYRPGRAERWGGWISVLALLSSLVAWVRTPGDPAMRVS